jgi:hypothetical protein
MFTGIRATRPHVSKLICEFVFEADPGAPALETLELYDQVSERVAPAGQGEIFNVVGAVSFLAGGEEAPEDTLLARLHTEQTHASAAQKKPCDSQFDH